MARPVCALRRHSDTDTRVDFRMIAGERNCYDEVNALDPASVDLERNRHIDVGLAIIDLCNSDAFLDAISAVDRFGDFGTQDPLVVFHLHTPLNGDLDWVFVTASVVPGTKLTLERQSEIAATVREQLSQALAALDPSPGTGWTVCSVELLTPGRLLYERLHRVVAESRVSRSKHFSCDNAAPRDYDPDRDTNFGPRVIVQAFEGEFDFTSVPCSEGYEGLQIDVPLEVSLAIDHAIFTGLPSANRERCMDGRYYYSSVTLLS